jgi:hypothetical protein
MKNFSGQHLMRLTSTNFNPCSSSMEALAETYLCARTTRDAIEKDLKLARQNCAQQEKRVVTLMNQHKLTRIHNLRFKLTLNLSKSDGQVRPYLWKRNYIEPSSIDSCLINGADEAIQEFIKARQRKAALELQRRKANDNLNQITMQLCNTSSQCKTMKIGQHKIVIIRHDNRVTLTKIGA